MEVIEKAMEFEKRKHGGENSGRCNRNLGSASATVALCNIAEPRRAPAD